MKITNQWISTITKEEEKIYLQGKLDILNDIREEMCGQVIGWGFKNALLEEQWKKIKEDVEKQIKELEKEDDQINRK